MSVNGVKVSSPGLRSIDDVVVAMSLSHRLTLQLKSQTNKVSRSSFMCAYVCMCVCASVCV